MSPKHRKIWFPNRKLTMPEKVIRMLIVDEAETGQNHLGEGTPFRQAEIKKLRRCVSTFSPEDEAEINELCTEARNYLNSRNN